MPPKWLNHRSKKFFTRRRQFEMYFASYYTLDKDQVEASDDRAFPAHFLRKPPRSLDLTNDPGQQSSGATVKPGKHDFDLNDTAYMFCAKSKGHLTDAFKSSRYELYFTTNKLQISVLFYAYDADKQLKTAFALAKAKAKEQKKKKNSEFSLKDFSVGEMFQVFREGSVKDFRLSGYTLIAARTDWFSPITKGHIKLMGDSRVSAKTIAGFAL